MKRVLPSPAIAALLDAAGLPAGDLDTCSVLRLFASEREGALVGTVGYELYGQDILLRSLAVAPGLRGSGLGGELVSHAEAMARQEGARTAWLLTTTADRFFATRGYAEVGRRQAPDSIRATAQFSSLCPASSSFMCKRLES